MYRGYVWFCQKVLPLVYDESLSYYEVLCKLTDFVGELTQKVDSIDELANQLKISLDELIAGFEEYKAQINSEMATFQNTMLTNWNNYKTTLNSEWEAYKENLNSEWSDYQSDLNAQWVAYKQNLTTEWTAFNNQLNSEWNTFRQEIIAHQEEYETRLRAEWTEYQEHVNTQIATMNDTLEAIKNGEYVDLYLPSIENWINNNLQQLVHSLAKQVMFGLDNRGHLVAYIPDSWEFLKFSTDMGTNSPTYGHLIMAY